jgi:hypothetical protein
MKSLINASIDILVLLSTHTAAFASAFVIQRICGTVSWLAKKLKMPLTSSTDFNLVGI